MPYKNSNTKYFKKQFISFLSFVVGIVLLILLFFFIKPSTVLESLKKIALWQIGLILALRLVFSILGALKWKVILNYYKQKVSLWKLYLFRHAVFSISYFTPIAAVGGQVIGVLLLKNEKVRTKIGVLTVLIDSVLTPITALIIGITAISIFLLTRVYNLPHLIVVLVALPLLILYITLFLMVLNIKRSKKFHIKKSKLNFWLKWKTTTKYFLFFFSEFFRKNKKGALTIIFLNLVSHAEILFEIFLVLYFLGIMSSVLDVAIIEAGYEFAFAIPVSQALGTAEATGAYTLQLLGAGAALGVTLTLILRLRHLLIGIIGITVLIVYGLIKFKIRKLVIRR